MLVHNEDPLYSMRDAAAYLGFRNVQSLRNLRCQGDDPDAVVIGRNVRYRRSALEKWIEQHGISYNKIAGGVS